jgi:hypothetical protein
MPPPRQARPQSAGTIPPCCARFKLFRFVAENPVRPRCSIGGCCACHVCMYVCMYVSKPCQASVEHWRVLCLPCVCMFVCMDVSKPCQASVEHWRVLCLPCVCVCVCVYVCTHTCMHVHTYHNAMCTCSQIGRATGPRTLV